MALRCSIGYIEDWTQSIVHLCLRCSYGAPHRHDARDAGEWTSERNLGIGAQSLASVERLLADWVAGGPDRTIDAIESREEPLPEPQQGHVWWLSPADEGEEASTA